MISGELKSIERDFELTEAGLRDIIKGFHSEMRKGLSGDPSSLKMIPTYIDRPTGNETGEQIAIDLGGTNFRILGLMLKGRGRISSFCVMKFTLQKRYIASTGKRLFGFIARSLKKFIKNNNIGSYPRINLGFTFSFPVKQSGISSGKLVAWTKGFSARGVEGNDVVALLDGALKTEGIDNVSVAALLNDTTGTLAARSYGDKFCDMGVIVGTGTNACYVEKAANIKSLKRFLRTSGNMIVNIEWGNFNAIKTTSFDRELDEKSGNPGAQMLEKMVSGKYLGEICRLVMLDLIEKGFLFKGIAPKRFKDSGYLTGEFLSRVLADNSRNLSGVNRLLREALSRSQSHNDRKTIKKICGIISARAARITGAAIAAVVTKIDPEITTRHTIAIDGSVYEKLPKFAYNVKKALKELTGQRAGNINLALTKDGSGRGAAIIAAVASAR